MAEDPGTIVIGVGGNLLITSAYRMSDIFDEITGTVFVAGLSHMDERGEIAPNFPLCPRGRRGRRAEHAG